MTGEASTDMLASASNAGSTLQAPSPQSADSVQGLPGELCELPGTVLGAPPDGVVAVADAKVDRPTTLLFAPSAVTQHVRIRLVGVPVDRMLEETFFRWWPLEQRRTATVPVSVPTSFFALGSQKLG